MVINSIAASMMGAHHVVGVDCDQDALDLAWVNMKKLEIENLDLIKCDLNGGLLKSSKFYFLKCIMLCTCVCRGLDGEPNLIHILLLRQYLEFDTVVMNPPFGTRNTGIDTIFLLDAMKISSVVYSLHKTSTREVSSYPELAKPH